MCLYCVIKNLHIRFLEWWCNYNIDLNAHFNQNTITGAELNSYAQFGPGASSQPLERDYIDCVGTEAEIKKCSRRRGNPCFHSQDASVVCS